MERSPLQVTCPTCSRLTVYSPDNPWRPFCSERCRSVDLGAWANEQYRVGAAAVPDDDAPEDQLPTG